MSVHSEPLSSLPQLRGLLEVTRLVREERDLTRLSDAIAATISDALGFGTVVDQPLPARRRRLRGHDGSRQRGGPRGADRHDQAGRRLDAAPRRALPPPRRLSDPARRGRLGRSPYHVPDLTISEDPDAWHPEDALIVPMRGADGTLLGVVSVDEPAVSVCGPSDEELDVLVAFAQHVIGAIEAVQDAAEAARDRASLAPAARHLRLARRRSTRPTTCSRPSPAESRRRSSSRRSPSACSRRQLLPGGNRRLGAGRSRARFRPDGRRPGSAVRAGVRDRGVLPDRERRRDGSGR